MDIFTCCKSLVSLTKAVFSCRPKTSGGAIRGQREIFLSPKIR